MAQTGQQKTGGRLWYKGITFNDETFEVFAEDCSLPLRNLALSSPRSIFDSAFSFSFADINRICLLLGIPWEESKDTVFAYETLYLGLLWSIIRHTVRLSEAKRAKYLANIADWKSRSAHILLDVQKLYGKLLHACLVIPTGRAYLTSLEAMLGACSTRPFIPHHPVRHIDNDLTWWSQKLGSSGVERPITRPLKLTDVRAFSDASTSVGLTVVINGYWRAWTLRSDWRTIQGQHDIGWAESVGFELLVCSILISNDNASHTYFRVFCDNQGVVNAWKNGKSRNRETNLVFRRIHDLLESHDNTSSFHLCYVPSRDNPADGPSRGIFPPISLLLPPVPLPAELVRLIYDADLSPGAPKLVDFSGTSGKDNIDNDVDEPAESWDWGEELLQFQDIWKN